MERDDAYWAGMSAAVEAGEFEIAGPVQYGPNRVKLTLIVLYVSDVEASQQFYAGLGLILRREQHDGGPVHYSTKLSGTVLELYPAGDRPVTRTRLELGLPGVGEAVTARDPDGNVVVVERIGL